jgi:putative component of toxin-antitoxin plasmid stabilization module
VDEDRQPGRSRPPIGRYIRTPRARRRFLSSSLAGAERPRWTIEVFEADDGTVPFERFAGDLPDDKYAALRGAVLRLLARRGLSLVGTEWLKPLGAGLHEFRIRHDAQTIQRMFGGVPDEVAPPQGKVLLRVFVHFHGDRAILLLGGYDKGTSPKSRRQQREIAEARRLLAQFKERQRRQRRRR